MTQHDDAQEQEPGCPLLDLLPPELLEALAGLLPLTDRLAWRRCSRPLRDAFDATGTEMTLGAEVGSDALLGLVRRMPRLASLEVAEWWRGVDWHAVLSVWPGGGLHTLRVGELDRLFRGALWACTPPEMLRAVGEACGAALRRLEVYGADSRRIEDFSGLAPCTALTRLVLGSSLVRTVDALASCATLQHVDLRGSYALEDVGGLASSAAALEHLDVSGCLALEDLALLTACKALRHLNIQTTQTSHLSQVAACTALEHLNFRSTAVSDVAPLAGLTALRHLCMGRSRVSDVAPLTALTALTHLAIGSTALVDLSPLTALAALQHLGIDSSPLATGFGVVAACTELRVLSVEYCDSLPDLGFVAALAALAELTDLCFGLCANVVDLAVMAAFTALRRLRLELTGVTCIRALAACTALQLLDLGHTRVSCIAALASCTALESLNIHGTSVFCIAALAPCAALETLHIGETGVSCLGVLASCPRLRYLGVGGPGGPDLAQLDACTALEKLTLLGPRLAADVARFKAHHDGCVVHLIE